MEEETVWKRQGGTCRESTYEELLVSQEAEAFSQNDWDCGGKDSLEK